MEHHLQIDSVRKSFNEKIILSDVYLEIKSNEIIGIHGRNGSGKTTLLRILFGMELAQNCFIKLNNKPITKPYKIKNLIAFSSQECFLPKTTSVIKILNLSFPSEIPEHLLLLFKDILYSKIQDLSGGERKLLQTYIILHSDAKFIILDEPFSKVAPLLIEELKKMIIQQSTNKGIILCDHNYRDVLDITDHNYVLKNASLKKIKTSDELIDHGYLL